MATSAERSDTMASDTSGTVNPMEFPKETPPEMMPILTLLHSHQQRDYNEGYLMILNDLNSGMCYFFFYNPIPPKPHPAMNYFFLFLFGIIPLGSA